MTPPDIPTPPTQFLSTHPLPAAESADKTPKLEHLNTQKMLSKGTLSLALHLGDKEWVHQRAKSTNGTQHPSTRTSFMSELHWRTTEAVYNRIGFAL